MKNHLCEMFEIDVPIFAFSHCRDVVVEVSKAGGLGVLGTAYMTVEEARQDLKWIDDHVGEKPYGIDILVSPSYQSPGDGQFDPERLFSKEHRNFVQKILDDAGVPPLADQAAQATQISDELAAVKPSFLTFAFLPNEGDAMLKLAFERKVKLIVSAFGTPPQRLIERAHSRGVKVAALASATKHAIAHKKAGCDFVIAVGTEAAGHTGTITSLVLWPRIVDAVSPLPVIGGGGVGRGSQFAAALALGCEGVWCGSIWLKTAQSEVPPEIKAKIFAARPEDAVLTRSITGKPCRTLRNKVTDAWDKRGAPALLPPPLQQSLWWALGRKRAERSKSPDFLTYPVGQIVGEMTQETSVRQVVHDMLNELLESKERLDRFLS